MKTITEQLANYKSVHLNRNNIITHFIGIPLIIWSIALLLSTVSFTVEITSSSLPAFLSGSYHFTLALVIAAAVLVYYFILHVPLALMILICFFPLFYSAHFSAQGEGPYLLAGTVFFVGWVFQFIGHGFEKAKPAFIDDLNQLLIGPLFLIAEIYFALGLNKSMAKDIHDRAVEKRCQLEQAKA
ncbi:DUF962 domain-containing protein [Thalassomonas viridans]|uniref:DUF962 domain-containing protein n=1 Tax=Thalassomonas viridans TaxID=137584 RepID=A0AAE9YY12_9GAMM|nr:Mpo1-like protein [Thalassomonas viridans]WDE03018.1 DUF962 domain-containing protein [Thalassomonas viridans]